MLPYVTELAEMYVCHSESYLMTVNAHRQSHRIGLPVKKQGTDRDAAGKTVLIPLQVRGR